VHFAKANPQVKIIIAPHEVDAENIKSVLRSFPGSITYSSWSKSVSEKFTTANTNVLIIDNVGMLSSIYRYADIAYVGGGFGNDGVHNVLEAAVYGIPVLHGPEFEKYAEAIDLVECGGAIVINSAVELEKMVNLLLTNEELLRAKGKVAKDFVYSSQGATTKIIDHIYAKRLLTN
jgi:3-deoxy-D-manno-octulosonic-acid transferase